jgi:hypothetical protein
MVEQVWLCDGTLKSCQPCLKNVNKVVDGIKSVSYLS